MFVQLINNPWIVLAIPPGIVLLLLILRKPIIGVYVSAFFIPLEDLTTLSPNVTLLKLLLAYTFMAWLLRVMVTKDRIKVWQMGYIIVLVFWCLISLSWSFDLRDSLSRLSTFFQLIVFSIMAVNLLKTRSEIEKVMVVYSIASVLTAVVALILLSTGVLLRNRAAFIEGQNPNGFSRSLGMALLFITYFLQSKKFKYKYILYPIGVLFLVVIVFAQSRGTYIALIAAMLILAYYSTLNTKLRIVLIGVIAVSFAFYLFPDILLDNVIPRTQSGFTETSMGGRDVIWIVGLEMIRNHPIIGVGFGNFTSIYGQYSMSLRGWYAESDPHNVFVAFQAELGIVGTIIFAFFLFRIYRRIKSLGSNYATDRAWIMSFFIYIIIGAMTNSLHYTKFFWLALAIVVAFVNQQDFVQIDGHPEDGMIRKEIQASRSPVM
jgi:putative inorganic carbon (hco3(-)) transporter